MAKSSNALLVLLNKLTTKLAELKTELAEAQAREVFNVGAEYNLKVGSPANPSSAVGVLLGSFATDKGATKLRFQIGSGMDTRIVDLSPAAIVVGTAAPVQKFAEDGSPVVDAEGNLVFEKPPVARTSGVIASVITKTEDRIIEVQADYDLALAKETLEVGKVYTIKYGRGEKAFTAQAMLYAQRQDPEKGTQLRFFLGEGFDARFIDGTPSLVQFDNGEELDDTDTSHEEAAQLDVAGEVAATEGQAE